MVHLEDWDEQIRFLQLFIMSKDPLCVEFMFLYAGKFMPGMEKLAGELFFPTNQQLFLRP